MGFNLSGQLRLSRDIINAKLGVCGYLKRFVVHKGHKGRNGPPAFQIKYHWRIGHTCIGHAHGRAVHVQASAFRRLDIARL